MLDWTAEGAVPTWFVVISLFCPGAVLWQTPLGLLSKLMFGSIEAGGTKFVCGVGTGPADLKTMQFPTTSPAATLAIAIEFLREESAGELKAVGIGSFGPIDLHSTSLTFGYVTSTPKAGWQNYNLAGTVRDALGVPVGFDTDVSAAALGEARWGAAQNLTDFLYLTIGTGIGGGAIINGRVLHGLVHPEMGHIRVPHDLVKDPYPGGCPYHGDCLEGLASGPAMQARWGKAAQDLPPDHPAWTLEAHYLAHGSGELGADACHHSAFCWAEACCASRIFSVESGETWWNCSTDMSRQPR